MQRNAKVYGPANALTSDSSCWNSEGTTDDDESSQHWFRLDFGRVVQPTSVALQFQAGFVAQEGRIECLVDDEWHVVMDDVEWDDAHEVQTLALTGKCPPCLALRIVLEECTDFYGRVILYQVQVWGQEQQQQQQHKDDDDEAHGN